MTCDDVQQELSASSWQEFSFVQRWRLQRHLTRCAACAAVYAQYERLEAELCEWRNDALPPRLKERIIAALPGDEQPMVARPAQAPQTRRYRFRPRRFARWGVAVSLMTLAFAALMIGLRDNPAEAMRRMRAAVSHIESAHMTAWWREGDHQQGAMRQTEELWYQQGHWRKRSPRSLGGDRIIADDAQGRTYYQYDPRLGNVAAKKASGRQVTAFSLEALTENYFPFGASTQVSRLGTTREGGRTISSILVTMPSSSQRMLFWIDTGTNLPVRAEKQVWTRGQWASVGKVQFEFNRPLPVLLFDRQSLRP